ncbi:MAG: hypothetical protein ABSF63_03940 [Candidatus Bathyarchaeia archaeon]
MVDDEESERLRKLHVDLLVQEEQLKRDVALQQLEKQVSDSMHGVPEPKRELTSDEKLLESFVRQKMESPTPSEREPILPTDTIADVELKVRRRMGLRPVG